jgi:hypothetical protein
MSHATQAMMKLYDRSVSNEVYQIPIGESVLFKEYIGFSFSHAAYASFQKGVTLVGVKQAETGKILLNPGSTYVMVRVLL